MKKILIITLISMLSLFVTSCIEFTEEITFNADGSGTLSLTIDAGKMMAKLQAMSPDREGGFELMKEDDMRELDSLKQVVNEREGISNFNYKAEGAEVSFNFDFDKIEQAYGVVDDVMSNSQSDGPPGISGLGNPQISWVKEGKKITMNRCMYNEGEGSINEGDDGYEMVKKMFEDVIYTNIIHFPGKVKVSGSKKPERSADKKSVTITASLMEIMEDAENSCFTVKCKTK